MKFAQPKPFTFEAGNRAVLLLHGFTGQSADVRMLGRFLEKRGYTSHAPIFKGHGVPPEQLVQTNASDWWEDVLAGYQLLKDKGYEEIAVAGLSLGGVFSVKLGYTKPIKGMIPMCTPMFFKDDTSLTRKMTKYITQYKKAEGKQATQLEEEVTAFMNQATDTVHSLKELVQEVRSNVDMIYAPTMVVQSTHDEVVDTESAKIIYNEVETDQKELQWYDHSSHVITLDKEKDKLHEDVYQFLESLSWSE